MDIALAASDAFIGFAGLALMGAPLIGVVGGWRRLSPAVSLTIGGAFLASLIALTAGWWRIAGGGLASLFGHMTLVVSTAALVEGGRLIAALIPDRLAAGLAALAAGVLVSIGVFALGPLTADLSTGQAAALLLANPLVAVTSAAGIDLLHLDTIYRTSPLAHRGVALPAWTTACTVYAISGIALRGASRLRPWSR